MDSRSKMYWRTGAIFAEIVITHRMTAGSPRAGETNDADDADHTGRKAHEIQMVHGVPRVSRDRHQLHGSREPRGRPAVHEHRTASVVGRIGADSRGVLLDLR